MLFDQKSGRTFKAKRVIVAVPITTLQKDEITFSPPLPGRFRDALVSVFIFCLFALTFHPKNHAGVGVAVKGVIRFSRAFWPPQMLLCFCSDSPVPQLWMDPPRPAYNGKEPAHAITCFVTGL